MIKVGSDPEYVIAYQGQPVSSIGLIGGSKHEPRIIEEGYGLQEDNVMVEITIPPAESEDQFVAYMNRAKQLIQSVVPDFEILDLSSVRYDEDQLLHPDANLFGCDPAFSIYTKKEVPRPTPQEIGNLRSAGFHIHIGFDRLLSFEEIEAVINQMDIRIGIPSLSIDPDTERRKLYGAPGEFRFKHVHTKDNSFTIAEYRTLGGYMKSTEELIRMCYRAAIESANHVLDGNLDIDMSVPEKFVQCSLVQL